MKIQKTQNPINFNGLYFKKVSPQVQQAFKECPAIQKLTEYNDVFISQYSKKVHESFGDVLEYGYKCKIKSLPNLFCNKAKTIFEGVSEAALDMSNYHNKEQVAAAVTEDLLEEISYLSNVEDFIENFTTVIKKDFSI